MSKKITAKLAGILALALFGHWPATALAAHPLLTEDTATQGAGRYQIEVTCDHGNKQDADIEIRVQSINAVLSVGLTDNLDVIATLPYERLTERLATLKTTAGGYADMEIGAKWRFYEEGSLSFALRPGLELPTGDEDIGLSTGHVVPKLFAVTTYTSDPWAFHLHLGYRRNFNTGPEERGNIYHASVAIEYNVNQWMRLVGDASIQSNAELSGHPNIGSMVFGLVYSLTPDLDLDLGYRKGLTEPHPDYALLAGFALRF